MKGIKGFQKGHAGFRTQESYILGSLKGAAQRTGQKRTTESKLRMSQAHQGRHYSLTTEFKKGQPSLRKGQHFPEVAGEKHYAWKGGVSTENQTIRHSLKYRVWRDLVFRRDDYTCQACGKRGGKLNADHELPFAFFPALRFEVLNGRVLCVACHKKSHTPGWSKIYSIPDFIY